MAVDVVNMSHLSCRFSWENTESGINKKRRFCLHKKNKKIAPPDSSFLLFNAYYLLVGNVLQR